METDGKLRQAINSYIDTFHEVRRLVELITALPIMQEEGLLRYGNNGVLQSWRLTTKDIESLYHRLTHSTLTEDINNGIVEDIPDVETISRRLKHLKFSLNQADIFKIEDIDFVFGDKIPTTRILTEIMVYSEAYDYVNTAGTIFREWNLIVDCLNKVIFEIESEFLTPQPDISTELPPIFQQFDIFKDNPKVARVFMSLIEVGLMKIDGSHFRWEDDRTSLCFLCYSINIHYDISTNKNIPWVSFKNMFLCQVWGKWTEQTNNDLRDHWQHFQKKVKSDYDPNGDEGKILPPRGKQPIWEKIENAVIGL